MAGFLYKPIAASGDNRLRHFINLGGDDRQVKVGTFELPTSGIVEVTDVGFEPEALLCFGIILPNSFHSDFDGYAVMHLGFATSPDEQWGGGIFGVYLGALGVSQPFKYSDWSAENIICCPWGGVHGDAGLGGSDGDEPFFNVKARLQSFNTNGFTIQTISPADQAVRVVYFAMREGGNYACGTNICPSTSGVQTITGLGFHPRIIFMATSQNEELTLNNGFHRLGLGAGSRSFNMNVWSGTENDDPYHDNVMTDNRSLSMMRETNAAGPFDPVSLAEATIIDTHDDGFTLDWPNTDGTQRYFSWFAIDGDVETRQWNYKFPDSTLNDVTLGLLHVIETNIVPKGLIFFMNDLGVVSRDYPTTAGDAMGLGVCDSFLNQEHISYMTVSPPFIGNNQINTRAHHIDEAFGCYERRVGALTAPNFGRDRGKIVEIDEEEIIVPIHLSRIKFRAWQESEV